MLGSTLNTILSRKDDQEIKSYGSMYIRGLITAYANWNKASFLFLHHSMTIINVGNNL